MDVDEQSLEAAGVVRHKYLRCKSSALNGTLPLRARQLCIISNGTIISWAAQCVWQVREKDESKILEQSTNQRRFREVRSAYSVELKSEDCQRNMYISMCR